MRPDLVDPAADDGETLVHLLDRALDTGVVVLGDLTISVANVDLVYVGLKLFIGSVEARDRLAAGLPREEARS